MKINRLLVACLVLALVLILRPAPVALAATYIVNTTADENDGSCSDGDCSLRDAILLANSTLPADTIQFNISGSGVHAIQPTSALPNLSGGSITIDGYSQPGSTPASGSTPATILIEIDGSLAGNANGFNITSANNIIKGLAINRFIGHGIVIFDSGSTGNSISGNYIGTDTAGTTDLGNSGVGIYIGRSGNTVGGVVEGARNLISGNDMYGIMMNGSNAVSNIISGNYIGTNASGTAGLGTTNTSAGIYIDSGASNNTVGGTTLGQRNVISGKNNSGIWVNGSDTSGNLIYGNYIGTDASGTLDLGNNGNGIRISGGTHDNTVGGNGAEKRNVISGNNSNGIWVYGSGTNHNTISGNYIGTVANGAADLGNSYDGIRIESGATNTMVGGSSSGERNIISGNIVNGVYLAGSTTTGNLIQGNFIGTTASGTVGLGNSGNGIVLDQGTRGNTVGPDNLIAYNTLDGVVAANIETIGNIITQNSIFDNGGLGISLMYNAHGNIAAPVIIGASPNPIVVFGTACPDCVVEIFASVTPDGEGETFVGSTLAIGSGIFNLSVGSLPDPYLTATATDATKGTSQFSAVFVYRPYVLYQPLIYK